jgi:Acetyltransferases, including N-acetylases of ribosomal proteins
MQVKFGDLPLDAQQLLTKHLRIDFSSCSFAAPQWFAACARNEKGYVTGIFAAEFQTWFEAKITVLVLDQRCCSRRVLRAIFTALFSKAKRLTAEVEPDNVRSLRQVQRLGFHFEGHHPLGLEGTRDTIIFGMLKDECPWLRSYVPPASSAFDVAHRHLADTIVRGDGSLYARIGADRQHLGSSKLCHLVALAILIVGMAGTFSSVLAAGNPAQMPGTDTSRGGAFVPGVFSAFRFAVREAADDTMHFAACDAVVPHLWIASGVDRKRPEETCIRGVKQGSGEDVFSCHPLCINGALGVSQITRRLYHHG